LASRAASFGLPCDKLVIKRIEITLLFLPVHDFLFRLSFPLCSGVTFDCIYAAATFPSISHFLKICFFPPF
jgi:hypothetical protein